MTPTTRDAAAADTGPAVNLAAALAAGTPVVSVHGDATVEEVAAVTAAVLLVWPRPAGPQGAVESPRWRFSGRWWSKPIPSRRDRP